jgi:hypothetical protein
MRHRYQSSTLNVADLPGDLADRMTALYLANYDGSSPALFRRDLAAKDEAILVCCGGNLVGFTTLRVFGDVWHGRPIRVVYSGDTIVDPAHWGQSELAFAWISRVGEISRAAPGVPLYWFLLVKGHRTFKYLPVFSKSFHPHWQHDRSDLKPLADQLAGRMFPGDYNPATGVVEFAESRGHLKDGLAQPDALDLNKAATRFFLARNPGYRRGHELVCICELALDNMKPFTARLFQRSPRQAVRP